MTAVDVFDLISTDPVVWQAVADRRSLIEAIYEWGDAGFTVRVVRGDKMRTYSRLLDEFAAAFQFPLYFRRNMGAFDEFMRELDWIAPGRGFVTVITVPELIAGDEPGSDVPGLIAGALLAAKAEWTVPYSNESRWDHPALPFHVVLNSGSPECADAVRQLWEQAGATVRPLEIPFVSDLPRVWDPSRGWHD